MRVKKTESVVEKIETGRFSSWSDLDDWVACSIVIPTRREEVEVAAFLKSIFNVYNVRSRRDARTPPDTFRFDSTRVLARLIPPPGLPLPPAPSEYDIGFEVQIRTAFEHAWSVATHTLTYKSQTIDWKRLRVTAQLRASIEQLDQLILSYDSVVEDVDPRYWKDVKDGQVVTDFILRNVEGGKIPTELLPAAPSRTAQSLLTLLSTQQPEVKLKKALRCLQDEIDKLGPDGIPRSLSLFQFALGVFLSKGVISPPFGTFVCHVTPELLILYPATSNIDRTFDYEN
jgi:ppGpp synthetase/RelA/SpoT-type nucleotidyltranferase